MRNNILVTSPLLPPIKDLLPYIQDIWNSRMVTNRGEICKKFEKSLCEYLGVEFVSLFSSATMALTLALKSLKLKGEIITTPFTFIATAQAIYWNNLKPVFVDIDRTSLNIDLKEVEKAISPDTCAILPVHVFGQPCDVAGIERISKKYNLKVVYDAAHCFNVKLNGKSVCLCGDLSVLSFHATKVFNSIEGGAVISHSEEAKKTLDALGNVGIDENCQISQYGLNARMNELQAACGLVNLRYIDDAIRKRKLSANIYRNSLKGIDGITMICEYGDTCYNYSYFPIIIDSGVFGATAEEVCIFLDRKSVV